MDFRGYGKGAVILVAVSVLAMIANQFAPQPAATPLSELPADTAPGCIARGADPAPPTFASAPDPNGIADRYVFDRLVEYDRRSGRLVSGLATSWTVSDDGLEYTFRLRNGVTFHAAPGFAPSRALTADDVVFTFSRLIVPNHAFHRIPETGNADFVTVGMNGLIVDVTRDGEDLVTFHLAMPYPKFLPNLSMDFASIRSAEYAKAMKKAGTPDRFAVWPVGTGPFAVAATGADGVRYAANPNYWGNRLPGAAPQPVEKQVVVPIPNAGID